ncbi:hypothetical protein D3C79_618670 [compost metagenome]
MIPGVAKMILMSCSLSQSPNQPRLPNISTNISPAITGETENGRSMMVMSNCRPGKRKRAIAQAAASPNSRLSGTEQRVTRAVSPSALRASGSLMACQKKTNPGDNAWMKTVASGNSKSAANQPSPSTISSHLTQTGSRVTA